MKGLFFGLITTEDMQKIRDGTQPEWIECDHCNGYGSSFKDSEKESQCTKCKGKGFVKR